MNARNKLLLQVSFVMLLMLAPLSGPSQAAPSDSPGAAAPIKLHVATFNPAQGEQPTLPPGLAIAGHAQGQRGYYIVQFHGPVEQGWKEEVTALGAELLDYLPEFAFKARMNPAQAARVAGLAPVSWVGLFHPAYKLSPDLVRDGVQLYRVRVERGADAGQATAAIARSGAEIVAREAQMLIVAAEGAQLEAIAHVLDVAWVENFRLPQKHNESGAGVIMGANTAHTNGYDGSTQTVAVADTGLGDGTATGAHRDIPASRVTAIFNWPGSSNNCYNVVDDGAKDVDSGHGTHVAVSVLGGGGPGGVAKGAAPAAKLIFQSVESWARMKGICAFSYPNGYYLVGIPADLRPFYQQAYNAGARIHSNSWGSNAAGAYTTDSKNTDDFVWANRDLVITFSAGNEGTDGDGNGVVNPDSIGSPATAKNVITVGASENQRADNYPCDSSLGYLSHDAYQPNTTCSGMGGHNLLGAYGVRWPADYPAAPLANDPTAGNKEQMAAFSSRGPADDGRIKPDVVAPGTWVLSGFSSLYQQGYGDPVNPQNSAYQYDGWGMPYDVHYKYMGGTSMSNPLAAGGAAVVRDFYQKAHTHAASAALVKATLINTADDLLDENNNGVNDNAFPIPNIHEGWGRVNLARATAGAHQFVDEAAGIGTGATATYQFNVEAGGQPFKVSLVWSDYPSSESASANLVNDLDLVVTAPGGATYRGNHFAGGWSQSGGGADRVNNVENVYVQSAAAGVWTVQVVGFNVPIGPQPFALVVDGNLGQVTPPPNTPPSVALASPAQGSTVAGSVAIQISASDAEDAAGSLTVEWNVDGGGWQATTYNSGAGYYEASWDSTTVANGGHTVNARAIDSAGAPATASNGVSVDNGTAPVAYMHIGNLSGSSAAVGKNNWKATVVITVHDANENPVGGATVTGAWSNGASGSVSCTTSGNGQCSVTSPNLKNNVASVTYSVTGVAHATLVYDAGANHVTTITIAKNGTVTSAGQTEDGVETGAVPIYLPFINR